MWHRNAKHSRHSTASGTKVKGKGRTCVKLRIAWATHRDDDDDIAARHAAAI
jgi:hypothetical protein